MTRWLVGIVAGALLAGTLWDAFETVVLPRRATGHFRLTRGFYRLTWRPWRTAGALLGPRRRESWLGFYGPLSLVLLLATWATGIVFAFGALQWALGSAMRGAATAPGFSTDVYVSGTTFFTLGLGDVVPNSPAARVLTVVEAGLGFALLAIVIGYFPVIYQSFSRREVMISLLDSRAGSPPTAGELLRRHRGLEGEAALWDLLHEWERWAADLLESHLSYPPLAYFRSQHSRQSWLAALAAILDTSALVMVAVEGRCARQAKLTFAMARHAVVDLTQVFSREPSAAVADRLPRATLARLRDELAGDALPLRETGAIADRLGELRAMYEPYLESLAVFLATPLPPWVAESARPDNWKASPWQAAASRRVLDDHF